MNKELLNLENTDLSYEAPFAEIVEIEVEDGFAQTGAEGDGPGSGLELGDDW
ncbi:MAG: hypothetical protein LBT04_03965 [Prevotellaceae bacterium]|jgi:hypothetical protein|nr:hypothetical protein [Prevotellaceae bacterium]